MRSILILTCVSFSFLFCSQVTFAQEFKLRTSALSIEYDFTSGVGAAIGQLYIEEINNPGLATNVDGWSLGVDLNTSLVEVSSVDVAGYLLTVNGGGPPAFFQPNIEATGFAVGVVYDFFGASTCTYEVEKHVLDIHYQTVAAQLAGNSSGAVVSPSFSDVIGTPPVATVIIVAGSAYPPLEYINGDIFLSSTGSGFIRGDVNGDGSIMTIPDTISLLNFLFSGTTIDCFDAADINDDSAINIGDAIYLLSWGFSGGASPVSPFPSCGADPSSDLLDCQSSSC